MLRYRILLGIIMTCALAACTHEKEISTHQAEQNLTEVDYRDLPGWESDTHNDALAAFQKSCARIIKKPSPHLVAAKKEFGTYAHWQNICSALTPAAMASPATARVFLETHFTPYAVTDGREDQGLFTGYYEPMIAASRTRGGDYQTPIYARPADLVMVNLGEFNDELKGKKIAGRVKDGYLKPYEDRAEIEDGKVPKDAKIIFWAKDPVDVFFLQIQGSGVVTEPSGATTRIGYDGQNGYGYTAIGKELVARGVMTKEQASMQSIRAWLAENPKEGRDLMRLNRSYTFFRILDTQGPVGAEGVVLTPARSLAVDHVFLPYGIPVFLDADDPEGISRTRLQKLLVAQDTGGAIKGVVRGDVFWGYGEKAAHTAGLMKSKGRFWVLLPKQTHH